MGGGGGGGIGCIVMDGADGPVDLVVVAADGALVAAMVGSAWPLKAGSRNAWANSRIL